MFLSYEIAELLRVTAISFLHKDYKPTIKNPFMLFVEKTLGIIKMTREQYAHPRRRRSLQ